MPGVNTCGPAARFAVGGEVAVIVVLAMSPPLVIDATAMVQAAVADASAVLAGTVANVPSSTTDAAAAEAGKVTYLVILIGTDNADGALVGPSSSSPL